MCIDKVHFDFGKSYIFEVDKDKAVMVPRGYANGLITMEPNTVIQYFVDSFLLISFISIFIKGFFRLLNILFQF